MGIYDSTAWQVLWTGKGNGSGSRTVKLGKIGKSLPGLFVAKLGH